MLFLVRRKYVLSEKNILERLAAGWGQGRGVDYRPFIRITDISSDGRVHLINSLLLKRELHFLSDLEWYNYLIRSQNRNALDFREQVALSREVTRAIASVLGYAHPRDRNSDANAIVMTTDLVVTYMGLQGPYDVAYFVKYAEDLKNPRVQEKLAIERRYWAEQGVELVEFTEEDIPKRIRNSLLWMSTHESLEFHPAPHANYHKELGMNIVNNLSRASGDLAFTKFMQELDRRFGVEIGQHLTVARHLMCKGFLSANLDVDRLAFSPVSNFVVNAYDFEIA